MVGGVGEYLSLLTGFSALLLLIAACYVGASPPPRRDWREPGADASNPV